jgi:hypothetical protein
VVSRTNSRAAPKRVREWSEDHPVARSIRRDGTPWFHAWVSEMKTPWPELARRTRISVERIGQLDARSTITRLELEALARAWFITPDGLQASMPDPSRVVG